MYRRLCFLFALVVFHSCVMHPPYERPEANIPVDWRLKTDEASSACNLRWWEVFEDPVLDGYIIEALTYNYDLKAAISRVWEYWAQFRIVRSGLFPQISGAFNYSRQELSLITSPPLPGVGRTNNIYQLGLNASYEVDIWGQTISATETALDQLFAQEEARRTFVLTLVSNVASAYIILRQYDMQLKISNETLDSRVESYKLALARWEGGLTSELEVKQAEAEVESARIEVKRLELLQHQQENLLSILVGRNPQNMERGDTLDAMNMPPSIPAGLPSDLLDQRPDIRRAEDLLAAANASIGSARAQFFPQITLTGQYGNESFALHNLLTNPALTWQFALNTLQPLFTGGRLTAQVDLAEAETITAYYTYLSAVQHAFQEVDDALIFHKIALELVDVLKGQVKVLTDYLHLATLQYENGQTDYLNVLDAERQLFESQLNYVEAKANSFLSVINLYRALGGGWVFDADAIALDMREDACVE